MRERNGEEEGGGERVREKEGDEGKEEGGRERVRRRE